MLTSRIFISNALFLLFLLLSIFLFSDFFHSLDRPKNFLTFMNMGNRQGHLYDAVKAYQEHQIPLIRNVEFIDQDHLEKKVIFPMETAGDDLGMYYFIPLLCHYTGVEFQTMYKIFYVSLLILGFFIASLGFHKVFISNISFLMAQLALAVMAFYSLYILDVYSVVFICVSFLPWMIYLYDAKRIFPLLILILLSGLVWGTCNQLRNHTGTGMLVLIILGLLMHPKLKKWQKISFVALWITFFSLPYFFMKYQRDQRDQKMIAKGFDERLFKGFNTSHIFWHSVYLGLGYDANNPYGIKWSDDYGYQTARNMIKEREMKGVPKINPLSMPSEYETLIQEKFMTVFLEDPGFVIKTWSLKFWAVLKQWVWFFNVGLVLLFFSSIPKNHWVPMGLTILFYLIPGVLVYPYAMYILGGLFLGSFATIFLLQKIMNERGL